MLINRHTNRLNIAQWFLSSRHSLPLSSLLLSKSLHSFVFPYSPLAFPSTLLSSRFKITCLLRHSLLFPLSFIRYQSLFDIACPHTLSPSLPRSTSLATSQAPLPCTIALHHYPTHVHFIPSHRLLLLAMGADKTSASPIKQRINVVFRVYRSPSSDIFTSTPISHATSPTVSAHSAKRNRWDICVIHNYIPLYIYIYMCVYILASLISKIVLWKKNCVIRYSLEKLIIS